MTDFELLKTLTGDIASVVRQRMSLSLDFIIHQRGPDDRQFMIAVRRRALMSLGDNRNVYIDFSKVSEGQRVGEVISAIGGAIEAIAADAINDAMSAVARHHAKIPGEIG